MNNPLERKSFVRTCPHCHKLIMVSNSNTSLKSPSSQVEEDINKRKETIARMNEELVKLGATLSEVRVLEQNRQEES